ncbi:MAG: type III secretion system translocon subunit SctE [Deltaproteobacteria bacterium]|jgi:hypothetical protein|nr:type III secretion system translocon subunit SctE [Deltaproteobacteria bacterium]
MSGIQGPTDGNKLAGVLQQGLELINNSGLKTTENLDFLEYINNYLNVSGDASKPTLAPPVRGGLSLEVLAKALGNEEREVSVKNGLSTLEDRKKAIKENFEKKMDEIKERMEKLEEQNNLSPFMKIFKWVGVVMGAVAAVATTAIGIATGNLVLVVAGLTMAALAIDSIVSTASDGEYSLAVGISKGLQEAGVSEKDANMAGQFIIMGIGLVAACATLGVGMFGWGSGAANTATTVAGMTMTEIGQAASTLATGVSGVNMILTGSFGIYNAVLQDDIAQTFANTKDLEAILAKIQAAMEVEKGFLEAVMKKYQAISEKVMGLIQDSSQTQIEILAGDGVSSPTMA